jgi:hypothetical protein
MEKKRVIAGAHGPVATEENPRRFIGSEPVEINLTAYYARRMSEGELVEYVDPVADKAPAKSKKGGE